MMIWLLGCFSLSFLISCSFVHIPELHKMVIRESIVLVTLGYSFAIFLCTMFFWKPESEEPEAIKKLKEIIYSSYEYMVFCFVCAAIAYIFFDARLLMLAELLRTGIYFSFILQGSRKIEWPRFREWLARVLRFCDEYHIRQTWNIIVLGLYTLILVSVIYGLIIKEARWTAYGWALMMALLVTNAGYEVWKDYKKRTKGYTAVKKKQKELDKAQASLDRAIKNLEKLHNEKEAFQKKIEKKIQENPNCEEADIDKLMAEFDRHDSRIRMAEQVKQNLEGPVTLLQNEIQDIRNNDPETPENQARDREIPQRVRRRFRVNIGERGQGVTRNIAAEIEALERRERVRALIQSRISYIRDTLTRMNEVENNLYGQIQNCHNAEQLNRLVVKQENLHTLGNEIRLMAEQYITWANILLEDHDNEEAFNAMTEHGHAFINLQNRIADFERADDTLRLNIVSANFIAVPHDAVTEEQKKFLEVVAEHDENEDNHMGTDGYPICPNCLQEHNNYDNDQRPYCSSFCQQEDRQNNN